VGRTIKRLLDIIGASLGLVVLCPVIALVALAIRLNMGAPVVFRQVRPGYKGRLFTIYKFRTMRDAIGPDGKPLPDEQRLTTLGKIIRKTSMDELPQLLNVLKGEMSFVGPRPLLTAYLDRYSPEQARRHDVPPGITGWAQVNGRNAISWEQKFEYDVWYVDNWSLLLDLRILALTFLKVVRPEGISQAGSATMEEFMGSPDSARSGKSDGAQDTDESS
jgi:lipopolysaccharide/colanic/teichoic acid biosynthesis glycosyltransferase